MSQIARYMYLTDLLADRTIAFVYFAGALWCQSFVEGDRVLYVGAMARSVISFGRHCRSVWSPMSRRRYCFYKGFRSIDYGIKNDRERRNKESNSIGEIYLSISNGDADWTVNLAVWVLCRVALSYSAFSRHRPESSVDLIEVLSISPIEQKQHCIWLEQDVILLRHGKNNSYFRRTAHSCE